MERLRKELSSETEERIASLKASFKESIKRYKSSKSKIYREKAEETIAEVLEL